MLSILIPTFNYSVSNLLLTLEKELKTVGFNYEILCLEDGSESHIENNKAICDFIKNANHLISKENKGRISSRMALAHHAKYDWLLFLDADVAAKNETVIKNYSNYFDDKHDVIYGGYRYAHNQPNTVFLLRWTYGKTYEEVDAHKRNKTPYKVVISGNFMIKKHVFLDINSEIDSDGYGYDNIFGALMRAKKTKVFHIDNTVNHNGLDENSIFLKKVEKAVETLYTYYVQHKTLVTENSLLEFYKSAKRVGLNKIISVVSKLTKNPIRKQILGKTPNMKLLQFYKLGYLCSLSPK